MVQPNNHVPFVTKSQARHQVAVVDQEDHRVVQVHLVEVVDQADPSYQAGVVEAVAAFPDQKASVHQAGEAVAVDLRLDLLVVEVEAVHQIDQGLVEVAVDLVLRNLEVEVVVVEDQVVLIFLSAVLVVVQVVRAVVQVVRMVVKVLHSLEVAVVLVLEVN